MLAIDPSLRSTGWAFFVDGELRRWGTVEPEKGLTGEKAVASLVVAFHSLARELGPVDMLAVESQFVSVNMKVGLLLARVRGLLEGTVLGLYGPGIVLTGITPSDARKRLGIGQAARSEIKAMVADYVRRTYPGKDFGKKDDVTDAVAVGLAVIALTD